MFESDQAPADGSVQIACYPTNHGPMLEYTLTDETVLDSMFKAEINR